MAVEVTELEKYIWACLRISDWTKRFPFTSPFFFSFFLLHLFKRSYVCIRSRLPCYSLWKQRVTSTPRSMLCDDLSFQGTLLGQEEMPLFCPLGHLNPKNYPNVLPKSLSPIFIKVQSTSKDAEVDSIVPSYLLRSSAKLNGVPFNHYSMDIPGKTWVLCKQLHNEYQIILLVDLSCW